MKFIAAVALVLLTVYSVYSLKITEYGRVSSYKVVHVKTALAEPKDGEIQRVTVATPRKPNYDPLRIYGVKHFNHNEADVKVSFRPASFPTSSADSLYITVESPIGQGINSTFDFHGVHLNDGPGAY